MKNIILLLLLFPLTTNAIVFYHRTEEPPVSNCYMQVKEGRNWRCYSQSDWEAKIQIDDQRKLEEKKYWESEEGQLKKKQFLIALFLSYFILIGFSFSILEKYEALGFSFVVTVFIICGFFIYFW